MKESEPGKARKRAFWRLPQAKLVGSFATLIIVGSVLLSLPWMHREGRVSYFDALFTATSAVCVTGLIVVDTGADFTPQGQFVILVLILLGGLGLMTFAAMAFQIMGRRMSLQAQAVVQDTLFQADMAFDFKFLFKRILRITFAIELTGVFLLFFFLLRFFEPLEALCSAVFHTVSAFCNAGFCLYSTSLIKLRESPWLVMTVMSLIVLGGLGHTVLYEIWVYFTSLVGLRKKAETVNAFSVHARVVLLTTGLLILVGFFGILTGGLSPSEASISEKASGALFQSVTARTAGFNTVDIGQLPLSSLLLLVCLMFVGGSPGSCAGGVKTTSLAMWFARLRALLLREADVRLLGRRIPDHILNRCMLLLGLAIVWNMFGFFILLVTEGHRPGVGMQDVMFEQISAFGTVGLSTGITRGLSAAGRIWIILTMFVGRLGPLTIAMWLIRKERALVRYPEGKVMIG